MLSDDMDWPKMLRAGELHFAVVRSDAQYRASTGDAASATIAGSGLRALVSLDAQALTLLAKRDARIRSVQDLANRTAQIYGDATDLAILEQGFQVLSPSTTRERLEREDGLAPVLQGFCGSRTSLIALFMSHPSGVVEQALANCAVLVPVSVEYAASITSEMPYVGPAAIPEGSYKNEWREIPTLGLGNTLVASSATDADLVFAMVSTLFEQFYRFQSLYLPAVTLEPEADPRRLIDAFRTVELHEGALRYYERRGWRATTYFTVVGSFTDLNVAHKLATAVHDKFPELAGGQVQIRLATNGYYAVIVGGRTTEGEGKRRLGQVADALGIPDVYLFPASHAWGPDLRRNDDVQ